MTHIPRTFESVESGHGAGPQIAGVPLIDIGDEPQFSDIPELAERDPLAAWDHRYDMAERAFTREGFDVTHRGSWDSRIPDVFVWDDRYPSYRFLLNRSLLGKIKAVITEKGADLSNNEELRLALEAGEDAVDANFSSGAINAINASYYGSEVAFMKEAGLATMFVENRPLNLALGALLAGNTGKEDLRVKELCSGGKTGHWSHIAEGAANAGTTSMQVVLSDFVRPPVDTDALSSSLSVSAEEYSLFEAMQPLPSDQRFDAIIATYGFDSIWQPEDISITRVGNNWYQDLYRVKVADWNPRREELLEAMRLGQPLPNAAPHDYDGIYVEEAHEPVDIETHPFGKYILEHDTRSINFPGGLIKRVINAFEAQLTEGGIFVNGDVNGHGCITTPQVSGVAGWYKMEDYTIAKRILEDVYGLEVELLGLDELAAQYLPADWQEHATDYDQKLVNDNPTNCVMVIKRGTTQVTDT